MGTIALSAPADVALQPQSATRPLQRPKWRFQTANKHDLSIPLPEMIIISPAARLIPCKPNGDRIESQRFSLLFVRLKSRKNAFPGAFFDCAARFGNKCRYKCIANKHLRYIYTSPSRWAGLPGVKGNCRSD